MYVGGQWNHEHEAIPMRIPCPVLPNVKEFVKVRVLLDGSPNRSLLGHERQRFSPAAAATAAAATTTTAATASTDAAAASTAAAASAARPIPLHLARLPHHVIIDHCQSKIDRHGGDGPRLVAPGLRRWAPPVARERERRPIARAVCAHTVTHEAHEEDESLLGARAPKVPWLASL